MPKPPILVLFNRPVLPLDHPEANSEHDIFDTVADVVKILVAAGFEVSQLGIDHDPQPLLDELREHPPLAVFNLFEGLATQTATEVSVAALLEWLSVPFTGCPSSAMVLGRDKIRTKHLLAATGLPTPVYAIVETAPAPPWHGTWPAIVKPSFQDASIGIDQASVVTSNEQLAARIDYILSAYGPPALVEEFVAGREFHVNVIEDGPERSVRVLPLAEIAFKIAPERWPVYTFKAKWDEASDEYKDSPLIVPVELPTDTTAHLGDIAARTFRLLQCRDYARLDVRMDAAGAFHILEVNPNPYLNSLALVKGLEAIGRTHEQFVVSLALNAIARGEGRIAPGAIRVPVGVVTGQYPAANHSG